MKYHFYSDFDCIVKIDSTSIKVIAGTKTIVQTSDELDVIEVMPLNRYELLPYCFSLGDAINGVQENLVDVIKVNSGNTIIKLGCNYPKIYSTLTSLSTLSADYEVVCDGSIKLSCGQKLITEKHFDCTSAELYQKNNLIFCILSGHTSKLLLVLDEQNNIIVDDCITQIEHLTNGFQTLKSLDDMQKQGVVKRYEIGDSGVQKTGEYAVYINQSAKEIYSQKFVPLAFFEAVQASNTSLAKTYLTGALSSSITPAHLKAYFGDFDQIYDVSDINNFPSVCLYSSKTHTQSVCKLSMLASKIDNIEKI